MEVSLMILLTAAPVGACDVIYFHLWKFRLYQRPQSVKEEITHIIRGFVVPAIAGTLLFGRPEGLWFWVVAGLFALDGFNTLLDVIFEPGSRLPNIVPPSELAIHFIGTTMTGAAWATFMFGGWTTRWNPTSLGQYSQNVLPSWIFPLGYAGLAGALALVLFETGLFVHARFWRSSSATA